MAILDPEPLVARRSTTSTVPPEENFGALVRSAGQKYRRELNNESQGVEHGFRLARMLEERGVSPQDIVSGRSNRAFYNVGANTMVTTGENPVGDVVSELSHVQQDNQQPGLMGKIIGDLVSVGALPGGGNLYETEGTVEHEAHREIEPELWTELTESGAPRLSSGQVRSEEIFRDLE